MAFLEFAERRAPIEGRSRSREKSLRVEVLLGYPWWGAPGRRMRLDRGDARPVVLAHQFPWSPVPTPSPVSTPVERPFPRAALGVLALLGFTLISTETMPAGVLHQIASGMGTSEGVVGQFVSAYALGTVLLTVPAIALTRSWPRKRLLITGILAFLLANTVTALSGGVTLSLVSRFVAGGCSGTLWGMLAGYALRIAPPAAAGRALSLISVGAPVGIAFGTPLGTWLGTTFGWRWSFAGLSVLAVVVLVLVVAVVPAADGQSTASHRPASQVVRIPAVALTLVVIVLWMLGNTTTYTYIAPFLRAGGSTVPLEGLLLVFGLASIVGIALTAALIDRAPRALVLGCAGAFALSGVVLVLFPHSPVVVHGAVAVWGVAFGGASPQLQRPLAAAGGEDADVANSFLPVAFNVAIFAAGVLGALVLASGGDRLLPLAMTVGGGAAFAVLVLGLRTVYPQHAPARTA